jgi:hypothetical protein
MNNLKKEIIVKTDKNTGEIIIFWTDMKANIMNICSNEVVSETSLMSGSEASIDYMLNDCIPSTQKEIDIALKAIEYTYNEKYSIRKKLTNKIKKQIWS